MGMSGFIVMMMFALEVRVLKLIMTNKTERTDRVKKQFFHANLELLAIAMHCTSS